MAHEARPQSCNAVRQDENTIMSDKSRKHSFKVWFKVIPTAGTVALLTFAAACSQATSPNVTVGPTVQAAATSVAPTAQALQTQIAPTAQTVQTQGAPTARAVQTGAAPTVQAAQTQAAPTVQAARTQVAPTVQAVATSVAPAIATASSAQPVRVTNVNIATQDTTITVQNVGSEAANLSNWTLHVGSATTQLPSGVDLQPGQSVTLHTTSGTSDPSNVFLGQSAQAIAGQARPGAQVTLDNSSGSPVSSFVVPGA